MRRWSKALLVGAALTVGLRLIRAWAEQQRRGRADLSETLSRWEGEGGNVPEVEPPHPPTH